jgi:hypothetical protein
MKLFDFRLQDYRGNFTGNFQWKDRQVQGAAFNGRSIRNAFFEELELAGTGSIYHPNLFSYSLKTNLGLNQSKISRAGETGPYSQENGFFRDMLFQGILLPKKPYNLMVNYHRKYRQLNNNFFEDTYTYTRRWQLQANWRNPYFPSHFGASSDNRDEFYGSRQIAITEKRLTYSGGWGKRDRAHGDLRITHLNLRRSEIGLYDIRQNNTTFQSTFNLPFGTNNRHNFRSSVFGNYITGTDSIFNVNWMTTAIFNHRDNLKSNVLYAYNYYNLNSWPAQNHQISTELNHQLYLSLTTTLQGRFYLYTENGYAKKEWQLDLNWDYQKRLPKGQLKLNLKLQPRREVIHTEQGFKQRGEWVHVFDQFLPVLIPQEGILIESIEVTSLDGTTIYVNELDYRLTPYGGSVEIQRIPGSSIPDSVAVTIHYLYEGSPFRKTSYSFRTYGIAYQIQDFWGLEIGYKSFSARYPVKNRTTWNSQDPRQVQSWFLKLEYHPVSFELNHETSTSRITPYTQTSLIVNGILGSFVNQYLMVRTQVGWQILPLRNDRQKYNLINVEYFRRISRSLRGRIVWGQRLIHGSLNDLQERKWLAALKFSSRKMSLSFDYQYVTNTFFSEKETDQRCNIVISINPSYWD